jgi:hypothetical protein
MSCLSPDRLSSNLRVVSCDFIDSTSAEQGIDPQITRMMKNQKPGGEVVNFSPIPVPEGAGAGKEK